TQLPRRQVVKEDGGEERQEPEQRHPPAMRRRGEEAKRGERQHETKQVQAQGARGGSPRDERSGGRGGGIRGSHTTPLERIRARLDHIRARMQVLDSPHTKRYVKSDERAQAPSRGREGGDPRGAAPGRARRVCRARPRRAEPRFHLRSRWLHTRRIL